MAVKGTCTAVSGVRAFGMGVVLCARLGVGAVAEEEFLNARGSHYISYVELRICGRLFYLEGRLAGALAWPLHTLGPGTPEA